MNKVVDWFRFTYGKKTRVTFPAMHEYEQHAAVSLERMIDWACNKEGLDKKSPVGVSIGREIGENESQLLNAIKAFYEEDEARKAAVNALVSKKPFVFTKMEMDFVAYCDSTRFRLKDFVSKHSAVAFRIQSGSRQRAQQSVVPSLSENVQRFILKQKANTAVDKDNNEIENQDWHLISQTNMALPTTPGTPHRIVAEICAKASVPYVRQKLWQLEKDLFLWAGVLTKGNLWGPGVSSGNHSK